jgi:predicted secreted hydrolase
MYGGRTVFADGSEVPVDAERSFAKAHYEQHTKVTGTITVGDEVLDLDGLGLRDKSWGPRHWQALTWYRWIPIAFDDGFAMMLSVIGDGAGGSRRAGWSWSGASTTRSSTAGSSPTGTSATTRRPCAAGR